MRGWDEDDEFMPYSERGGLGGKQRKKSKQERKDESLYGIFAGSSSSRRAPEPSAYVDPYEALIATSKNSSATGFVSGGALDMQQKIKKKGEDGEDKPKKKKVKSKKRKKPKTEQVSQWEMHGKGLGRKLLKSMGWSGTGGLGKDGRGITEAMDVVVRDGNEGLGKRVEKTETMIRLERERNRGDDDEDDEEEEEEEEFGAGSLSNAQAWRRIKVPDRPKIVYKTAQQVLSEGDAPAAVKVVDLTGPRGPTVVSSVGALYSRTIDEAGPLREIRYNVQKLLNDAEAELRAGNRKLQGAQRRLHMFGSQVDSLRSTVDEDVALAARIEELAAMLERLERQSAAMAQVASAQELVPRLVAIFRSIYEKYPKLVGLHDIRGCLLSVLSPTLKLFFARWDCAAEPRLGTELMPDLREALGLEWYSQLIWQLVLPAIRVFVTQRWQAVERPFDLLLLLDAWKAHLPPRTIESITEDIVIHHLRRKAQSWNPAADRQPPHEWVRPWIQYLGPQLAKLVYPCLASQLSAFLRHGFDPEKDSTVFALVSSWEEFMPQNVLQSVGAATIVGSLKRFVAGWNPSEPSRIRAVSVWYMWIEFDAFFSKLLVPKLTRFLYDWLLQEKPSGAQVKRWYFELKAELPSTARVLAVLGHLLDIVNNIVVQKDSNFNPERLHVSLIVAARTGAAPVARPVADAQSFKVMVEEFATEHNRVFLPLARRSQQGHKLYSFGGIPIKLQNNVVYREIRQQWVPCSLEALIR